MEKEGFVSREMVMLDMQNLLKKAKDWAESTEGRRAIKSSSDKVNSVESNLQKERKVDPKSLDEPITL